MKIAIITYKDTGTYTSAVPDEDKLLRELFISKGHEPEIAIWDDADINWKKFDALIIKSTWDYFEGKLDAFIKWLELIEDLNIPCLNSPSIIKWNADKIYLKDIEAAGLKIVPSEYLSRSSVFYKEEFFKSFDTDELIVKPRISGGAKNTIRINKNSSENDIKSINELLKEEDYIIQPFIPEIMKDGEWSFIFFNGKFSHHLLKVAKKGDFRIQHYLGGTIHVPELPPTLLSQAEKIVSQFAADCLYARVDGVNVQGDFLLVELELIEPYLFLFTNENSLERYYDAFSEKMNLIN